MFILDPTKPDDTFSGQVSSDIVLVLITPAYDCDHRTSAGQQGQNHES
jgi:hypothetical protein